MKLATTLRPTRRSWLPLPLGEGWGEGTHGAGLAADASPHPNPPPTGRELLRPPLHALWVARQRNGQLRCNPHAHRFAYRYPEGALQCLRAAGRH